MDDSFAVSTSGSSEPLQPAWSLHQDNYKNQVREEPAKLKERETCMIKIPDIKTAKSFSYNEKNAIILLWKCGHICMCIWLFANWYLVLVSKYKHRYHSNDYLAGDSFVVWRSSISNSIDSSGCEVNVTTPNSVASYAHFWINLYQWYLTLLTREKKKIRESTSVPVNHHW